MHRINFDPPTEHRLKLHVASVPGRTIELVVHRAVNDFLERNATAGEKSAWDISFDPTEDDVLATKTALGLTPGFRLEDLLSALGIADCDQSVRRSVGRALREYGFVTKRKRPPGGLPTTCWYPPEVT